MACFVPCTLCLVASDEQSVAGVGAGRAAVGGGSWTRVRRIYRENLGRGGRAQMNTDGRRAPFDSLRSLPSTSLGISAPMARGYDRVYAPTSRGCEGTGNSAGSRVGWGPPGRRKSGPVRQAQGRYQSDDSELRLQALVARLRPRRLRGFPRLRWGQVGGQVLIYTDEIRDAARGGASRNAKFRAVEVCTAGFWAALLVNYIFKRYRPGATKSKNLRSRRRWSCWRIFGSTWRLRGCSRPNSSAKP